MEAWDSFYGSHRRQRDPLHNDDCIYTPGVMVFKSDTEYPRGLPEEKWYSVNVLTCAAPNLRERAAAEQNRLWGWRLTFLRESSPSGRSFRRDGS